MDELLHSVTLDEELCKGCTNCIKRCPTEAIRVRKGMARILHGRCIDCGECIRICPHHAKKVASDKLEEVLAKYEYTIALPAPSLIGQFPELDDIDQLLGAILAVGFDEVFEVAAAAELISDASVRMLASGKYKKPALSSACPTITRLIQIRFPDLIDNILPVITPVELAGLLAKRQAVTRTGLPPERIGTIFLTPCPAKITAIKYPVGLERSNVDAAVAIKDVYPLLLAGLKKKETQPKQSQTGAAGLAWGCTGGEAAAALEEKYLAADGIENCIRVLESLEDGKVSAEFIELNACPAGCVGGVLTVENPFVAMVKLKQIRNRITPVKNRLKGPAPEKYLWDTPIDYLPVMELDHDIASAIEKMSEVDRITRSLRGLDCGSCGSPSCRAFAEDIVKGHNSMDDCIFVLRESMLEIAKTLTLMGSRDLQQGAENAQGEELK